ncbi:hypothetical protein [Microvirga antarctica]|uniref:hypothetical protein n=1 Tax=Microvirga antarctica TaxID=2819233 RepID=UPI001FE9B31A|nr:hypothetical protein [Microvirga antarctica]
MFAMVSTLALAASLIAPVADGMPNFNPRLTCKADATAQDGVAQQTVKQCLADEDDARAKVEAQWSSFAAPLRARCAAETQVGGSPSYVEVLVCLRIGSGLNPQ